VGSIDSTGVRLTRDWLSVTDVWSCRTFNDVATTETAGRLIWA
jgi:hypothetical protein